MKTQSIKAAKISWFFVLCLFWMLDALPPWHYSNFTNG
jgi:hypothetical protein